MRDKKGKKTGRVFKSPFATVRLGERATKGAGSRTKGLRMWFKLLDMGAASLAAPRWRSAITAGSCRREVRRWSPGRSRQTRYSVN